MSIAERGETRAEEGSAEDDTTGRQDRITVPRIARTLGPGIVAGGSDTDPTTVASLSVIGATTAFALSWLVLLVIPMLVIVQSISGRIGVVARGGLEDTVHRRYGRIWSIVVLAVVLAVNLITLAADIEGGSAALGLLTGLTYHWFLVPFCAATAVLLIWGSYAWVERVLKYVLLIFLAYVATAFVAHPDWQAVAIHTFIPHLSFSSDYVAGALALLGTTLTSYAYVWESIATAERHPPLRRLGLVQVEAGAGMVFAGLIFYFILITTGATLGAHHTNVQTAQQAANALGPLAGHFSSLIFGAGLLASAVLAVPVLAGTSGYVMAEAFGWRRSLDRKFTEAPRFYVALLLSLVVGLGISLIGVSPIKLLFAASIAGGLGTPVTLVMMMLIGRDRETMGDKRLQRPLAIAGWTVAGIVTVACVAFIVQTVVGGGS